MGLPVIRGVVNFVHMLTMGMNTLQQSTDMLGIMDEEPTKFEKWLAKKTGKEALLFFLGLLFSLFACLLSGLLRLDSINWGLGCFVILAEKTTDKVLYVELCSTPLRKFPWYQ